MKIETSFELPAGADAIFDMLLDDSYYQALAAELDKVSNIELSDVDTLDDGQIRRVVRYTAPTQLPRFLRTFKDRAPDEVYWQETGLIDRPRRRMEFSIRAKAPEHWHERYDNQGVMTVEERSDGTSRIKRTLEYSVDVSGLSYIIERSLRSEVKNILNAQDKVLAQKLT